MEIILQQMNEGTKKNNFWGQIIHTENTQKKRKR